MKNGVWGYDYGWNDDTNIVSHVALVWTVQNLKDSIDKVEFRVLLVL